MNKAEIEEFQRRRRVWIRRGVLSSLALIALAIVVDMATNEKKFRFCFALIAFAVSTYFTARIYRCPRCNTIPYHGDGVALNPKSCLKCGAQLRFDE